MKRFGRNPDDGSGTDADDSMRLNEAPVGFKAIISRVMGVRLVAFVLVSAVVLISVVLRHLNSGRVGEIMFSDAQSLEDDDYSPSAQDHKNILLDGLLSAEFDERSCISRYRSAFYRKESPYKPYPYLISRLRKYEALHKKCGPHTESYKKAVENLNSSHRNHSLGSADCRYIVWLPKEGLGNRIMTLASTFLYALLTNRVLLVHMGTDTADLFCDPFPEVTWHLPSDFPLKKRFQSFREKSKDSYGWMLKNNALAASAGRLKTSFVYVHLVSNFDDKDRLFFCDENQIYLGEVPWLVMRSDLYFVPLLFLIPSFQKELHDLFPAKDTVFHFLGRYLFHPADPVWRLVTSYYRAYLANADERVGIQIRTFDRKRDPFQHVLDQVLLCALKQHVLPNISEGKPTTSTERNRSKAVLVASLSSWYPKKLSEFYLEHPTQTGEVIHIFQPSHEEYQQTDNALHNRKALAEMYLLSFMDVLITSAWSTFGYVAQGLGGLKPWILYRLEDDVPPDPPCQEVMSMEPCFHGRSPTYDCKTKMPIDTGRMVPHVRRCEDVTWGLKLVDKQDWD